jgi:hypothetical protein
MVFADAKAEFDGSTILLKQTISVLGQAMNSGVANAGDRMAQVLNSGDIFTMLLRRDL